MAVDVTMDDMDIDMGMDNDEDPEIAQLRAAAADIDARARAVNIEAMNGVEEEAEEGEVVLTAPAPAKVHMRGVFPLNTLDLQRYAEEHYSMDLFKKVEWVDDNAANFVYDTDVAAAEALVAFSQNDVNDPMQRRPAKSLSTRPELELLVRQAIVADVKVQGAKDRSRYYLLNQEWDPDNPNNIRPDNRKRRRPDDGYPTNKYRRRSWVDDRQPRRASREEPEFHEDMYDDEPKAAGDNRRTAYSSASEYSRRRPSRHEDLFESRQNGRLRNRSASPTRGGDGRYGFDEDQPLRPTARARSRTPPRFRAGRDNRGARENLRKELFPNRRGSSAFANSHTTGSPRELFQRRPSTPTTSKELFPEKVNGSAHRRRKAKDIHPDEVADAIGKCQIDANSESLAYDKSGRRPERSEHEGGRDLFSRIDGGPKVESSYGRLQAHSPDVDDNIGFNIKGASRADESPGFSIFGASRGRPQNPLVKELFPTKAGGADLFDGRIKGRGAPRRRAEDLF